MTKKELAYMYYDFRPGITPQPKSIVAHLMRMIKGTDGLLSELYKYGYVDTSQYFTPKQVQIIYKYLGEP